MSFSEITSFALVLIVLLFTAPVVACGDDDGQDDDNQSTSSCDGEDVSSDDVQACVYSAALLEDEDDFECPPEFPNIFDLRDEGILCTDRDELDDDLRDLLSDHGYEPADSDDRPTVDGVRICDDDEELVDDSYNLYEADIVDDELIAEVGYSGGCKEHFWTLCWSGDFMESDPVQVNLELYHDSSGDMCEAYIMDHLSFDLMELRDSYEEAYWPGPDTIIINLVGEDESLDYSWD